MNTLPRLGKAFIQRKARHIVWQIPGYGHDRLSPGLRGELPPVPCPVDGFALIEDRPRFIQDRDPDAGDPFTWPPGEEPKEDPLVQAIAQAAKELVEHRDRWFNAEGLNAAEKNKHTLTNLYNARPTWLALAHRKLDEAVFAAYGWRSGLSGEEILEKLLALNLERSKR